MTSVAGGGGRGGGKNWGGGEKKLQIIFTWSPPHCGFLCPTLGDGMEWNIISYPEQVRAGVTAEGGARPGVW